MSVTVIVYPTTEPGVVVLELAVVVIVRPGTSTVTAAVQAPGAGPDAGQVLPGVVEVTVSGERLVPGVGVVHGDRERDDGRLARSRSPVQVRCGPANETVPAVAVASPL